MNESRITIAARDGEDILVRGNDEAYVVSWHPPPTPPDGTPHGAAGVCVTSEGDVALISNDGEHWDLPQGRPEGTESWEQTLRREMLEEACAEVVRARLLGFARGEYVEGPQKGLVLVRSMWRADIKLRPWEPRFEIPYRRIVKSGKMHIEPPFGGAITRRALEEAGVL